MHVRKNDTVKVMCGKEGGKTGRVLEVDYRHNRVRVENLNIQKKHMKSGRSRKNPFGGIVDRPGPIHVSNVLVVCTNCNKAVRVGYRFQPEGTKVRYCRKCSETLEPKK